MSGKGKGTQLLVLVIFMFSFLTLPTSVFGITPIPNPELSSAPDRLDPIANTTLFGPQWLHSVGGFCVSQDNHVYTAVNYDRLDGVEVAELIKTDALGNLVWSRSNEFTEVGMVFDLAVSQDIIYTIGADVFNSAEEMIVNGFDLNGALLWSISLENRLLALETQIIATGPDGSCYVTCSPPSISNTVLHKISSGGELQWNCTLPNNLGGYPEIIVNDDNSIVYLSRCHAIEITAQGELSPDTEFDSYGYLVPTVNLNVYLTNVASNGDLLGYSWDDSLTNLTRFDSDGELIWSTRIQSSLLGEGLSDTVRILSMRFSPSGNLYVLTKSSILSGDIPHGSHHVLLCYNASGYLLDSWTVLYDKYNIDSEYNSIPMTFSGDGLLYIGALWFIDVDFSLELLIYNPENVGLPEVPIAIDLILMVMIVATVVIIGAVFVLRRRT